jgi:hypothetical protein
MNDPALAVALATAPSSAFVELRERPRFWFPLLLLIVATVAINYWYYSIVDLEWFKDAMFASNPHMSEQERTAAMGMVTRTTMLWSSVVGTVIFLPIVFLIEALLLFVAAKVTKVALGYGYWFAMACWSSLPALLGIVVAAIFLLMSDNAQLSPGLIQPLSLNELLVHLPMGSPGESLLQTLGIPAFLSWALLIIGVRTWTQRTWAFSAAFVLVPIVLVYGLWAFFAFRQAT